MWADTDRPQWKIGKERAKGIKQAIKKKNAHASWLVFCFWPWSCILGQQPFLIDFTTDSIRRFVGGPMLFFLFINTRWRVRSTGCSVIYASHAALNRHVLWYLRYQGAQRACLFAKLDCSESASADWDDVCWVLSVFSQMLNFSFLNC